MIPQRLMLKNFLSYREATLDFRGLHTACICGANGAGKSSLLEAIAWVVWGESRAALEDDVIHMGEQEALVDFTFLCDQHTYRILRSRFRGQTTTLEFQIAQEEVRSVHVGEACLKDLACAEHVEVRSEQVRSEESEVTPYATLNSTTQPHQARRSFELPAFRSITGKSVRSTQQLILAHIKLDYETFVNSAYLRQGRADEFMLKRPGDRKQILADLLKLDQYDELAEKAKDRVRQLKGQVELLERNLATVQQQLQEQEQLTLQQQTLETNLANTQQQQSADNLQLKSLQSLQLQHQSWQQQLTWQQQQQLILHQDCQRLQQELLNTQQQQQELEALLLQEVAIANGYAQFQTLQVQEEALSATFHAHQTAQTQRQHYQQQQAIKITELQGNLQQIQAQIEALHQQEAELHHTLSKAADVEVALGKLQQARTHLNQLDQLQAQAAPLLQRQQQVQTQLDRIVTRLSARLEELHSSAQQLQRQQETQPRLQQAVMEVSDRIINLEERKNHQQQIRDKGLERRSFMERLQADQREYETQLAEVEQKIQLLRHQPPENNRQKIKDKTINALQEGQQSVKLIACESPTPYSLLPTPYPPCPLCDRPLDEHHWQVVLDKHQVQQEEILQHLWTIREQLSASERELQILRQEYRELDYELAQYSSALERRGQLQEQLQTAVELHTTLQKISAEAAEIERSIQTQNYAADLQEELRLLNASLHQLNYDEKNHALARGDVDRWRWAEIKQAEIKQAQRRQAQIAQQLPELHAENLKLQQHLEALQAETTQQLTCWDNHLAEIGYDLERHNQLRNLLRQAQSWQLHYQELNRAKQHYPQMQQRLAELLQTLQERQTHLQMTQAQVESLTQQLEQIPDCQTQIDALERQIQQRRSHLDEQLAQLGRLQQQQQHVEQLKTQNSKLKTDLQATQQQHRIYQELAQAFGKNGIQTLMIENVLPQLEAETNQILSRLSANQLHVQFVTQKSNRRNQNPKSSSTAARSTIQNLKLIETLDILIADAQGTRPYETYSGGEAFRVNFAIRLALSRLLAQRSGTALQMLIIDEGFGTQDAEGCDRLIAAINAIAPDFAYILTITHVPHFKEAFQSRIEVFKTEHGSRLSLSV